MEAGWIVLFICKRTSQPAAHELPVLMSLPQKYLQVCHTSESFYLVFLNPGLRSQAAVWPWLIFLLFASPHPLQNFHSLGFLSFVFFFFFLQVGRNQTTDQTLLVPSYFSLRSVQNQIWKAKSSTSNRANASLVKVRWKPRVLCELNTQPLNMWSWLAVMTPLSAPRTAVQGNPTTGSSFPRRGRGYQPSVWAGRFILRFHGTSLFVLFYDLSLSCYLVIGWSERTIKETCFKKLQ